MLQIPDLPLPKLHRFFDPAQAKTYLKFFGIALLVQALLPWGGDSWLIFGKGHFWPWFAGVIMTVVAFVPAVQEKLKASHYFLIASGVGAIGLLTTMVFMSSPSLSLSSLSSITPLFFLFTVPTFWLFGFGAIGVAILMASLFLWARNGYQKGTWTMMVVGLSLIGLSLFMPVGGGDIGLIQIFTSLDPSFPGVGRLGDAGPNIFGRLVGMVAALAFLAFTALIVMNVLLKREQADQVQVERYANALGIVAFGLPVVYGLTTWIFFPMFLHLALFIGIYTWLVVWGIVCVFEARARGENLLQF